VILSGSPSGAIVEECVRNTLRVVLVNRPMPGVHADLILSDDKSGARLAADRLLGAGLRRLAVVSGGSGTPSQVRRVTAFREYATSQGAEVSVWAAGPTSHETGQLAARDILRGERPDGVFCVTDLLALGFMDAARHQLGLNIPSDLSVIGFDDVPVSGWPAYRLTTIRQSVEGLSAGVLAAVMRTDNGAATTLVPVELIERDSVRHCVK
jgi:DNA-binding LacI/PurR family transcriptional regulator